MKTENFSLLLMDTVCLLLMRENPVDLIEFFLHQKENEKIKEEMLKNNVNNVNNNNNNNNDNMDQNSIISIAESFQEIVVPKPSPKKPTLLGTLLAKEKRKEIQVRTSLDSRSNLSGTTFVSGEVRKVINQSLEKAQSRVSPMKEPQQRTRTVKVFETKFKSSNSTKEIIKEFMDSLFDSANYNLLVKVIKEDFSKGKVVYQESDKLNLFFLMKFCTEYWYYKLDKEMEKSAIDISPVSTTINFDDILFLLDHVKEYIEEKKLESRFSLCFYTFEFHFDFGIDAKKRKPRCSANCKSNYQQIYLRGENS